MRRLALIAFLPLAACSKAPSGAPPHQIHIAGSSAGYLLSTEVAERLMREDPDVLAPLVRAGGTGDGIARFCDKDNPTRPDILITTREMTSEEQARCAANGSTDIEQREIGTTAVVLVEAKGAPPIPGLNRIDVANALTSNAKTWAEIRPGLPAIPILIHGPTPTPAIADTLYGPILQDGQKVRTDGAYTGHGADAALVARIVADKPGTIGIIPLSQAVTHRDALSIVMPSYTTQEWQEIEGHPIDIGDVYRTPIPLFLIDRSNDSAPGLDRLLHYYDDAVSERRLDIQMHPAIR
jgi:phosphate transport system substrate-binding protein